MREVTVKLFSFDELDPKVQEKLIEKNRYQEVEGFPWYMDIADGRIVIDETDEVIMKYDSVNFDLDYNYRHIVFNGLHVVAGMEHKALQFLGLDIPSFPVDLNFSVVRGGWRIDRMELEFYATDENADEAWLEKANRLAPAAIRELCQAVLQRLSNHYDALTSDERVRENLQDSELEFMANGSQL